MTKECRPFLGPDTTYAGQRKNRMGDAIGDYLGDEEVGARQAYEEILSEAQEWYNYHKKQLEKAKEFLDLLQTPRSRISQLDSLD
jgi:uncharacterized protein YjbJ (UPF0337 family)